VPGLRAAVVVAERVQLTVPAEPLTTAQENVASVLEASVVART
jgi:hypothetical protein